ncbi:hypothetical protein FRC04_001112 [Tulasnella sp. 424]|nr:hypothetical protein FRC04_001112 [Tulasnella sp. 424]KAG8969348.1 hypothetical protein FRC05_001087 [Tulasnella sp. 425]
MAIYASNGDDLGRADSLNKLGNLQRLRSNYADAEASYTRAMAIYGNIGDDHALLRALFSQNFRLRPPPYALPDTIHAEGTAAAPLSPLATDPDTSESRNPSLQLLHTLFL